MGIGVKQLMKYIRRDKEMNTQCVWEARIYPLSYTHLYNIFLATSKERTVVNCGSHILRANCILFAVIQKLTPYGSESLAPLTVHSGRWKQILIQEAGNKF